mmetsp:Transcript_16713/g.32326  ORF Transcript_16713/g.32326 Transcript_16713/m.32326 type:complete len:345 (+) Transcript_16713:486-1520(+)|eukprot:CAMPEP_0114313388 /NCGR_PEP_ID=MMETSP0059-20121206/21091_1 /TAXON_ID=36894 /ORGANISM="Pyramimonas parkeae, Strain CCMP726" /LENGTH=344 /DNA_ID=CAMNT_0001438145 /DNA_START=424 /DNA_END=1458 /DNA_ORIENTATION=+
MSVPTPPPEEPGPEKLPPFFWLLLRGADAIEPPTHPVDSPAKIVMMHGWLQDHTCWLTTAQKLRDKFGHDVLLLDFYGHGRSPYLPNFYHMNMQTSRRQLRMLLEHVGWEDDAVVLAGLSFGGGVAQHYALHYPDHVERMVLLGSVGSPEPTWRPIPFFIRTLGWLNSLLLFPRNPENYKPPNKPTWLNNFRGKIWMARKYPTHDLPPNMPQFLRRYPLSLVWGKYDTLHSPQLRRWMCKDQTTFEDHTPPDARVTPDGDLELGEAAVERTGPRTDVNVLLVPLDHTMFCVTIDHLNLHNYPQFWHHDPHLDADGVPHPTHALKHLKIQRTSAPCPPPLLKSML